MAINKIEVASLFASLDLDVAQFRDKTRQAKVQMEEMAEAARTNAEKVKSALESAMNAGASKQFAQSVFQKLTRDGMEVNDVVRIFESNLGRTLVGLQDATTSADKLGRALRAVGASDIEPRWKALNKQFDVVKEAFDAGEISSRTFREAVNTMSQEALKYGDYLEGKVAPAQEKLTGKVQDTTKALKEKSSQLGETGTRLRRLGEDLTTTGLRLSTLVTAPIVGAGVAAAKFSGEAERIRVSIERITGSSAIANKTMRELRSFALESPFEFQGAAEGARRIIALTGNAENAVHVLRTLGDATAGVGGDTGTLNRFIKALGDIQAKGHLAGEEVRQLANIPIPAVDIIAQQLGKTSGEVLDSMRKKAIDASTAIDALMKGLSTRFGGELSKQAEAINVVWKNVLEKGQFVLRDLGAALTPFLKDLAVNVTGLIDTVGGMVKVFSELPRPVQNAIGYTALFAAGLGPVLLVTGQVVSSIGHISDALARLSQLGGIGAVLSGGLLPAIVAIGGALAGWQLGNIVFGLAQIGVEGFKSGEVVSQSFDKARKSLIEYRKAQEGPTTSDVVNATKGLFEIIQDTPKRLAGLVTAYRPIRDINREFYQVVDQPQLSGMATVKDPLRGDLTSSFKREVDQKTRDWLEQKRREREEADKGAKELERQARQLDQQMQSLGLKNTSDDIAKLMSNFSQLVSTLSPTQTQVAGNTIIEHLNKALDEGSIGAKTYLANLTKVEDAINKKGGRQILPSATGLLSFEDNQKLNESISKMGLENLKPVIDGMVGVAEATMEAAAALQFGNPEFERMNAALLTSRKLTTAQMVAMTQYKDAIDNVSKVQQSLRMFGINERGADIEAMRGALENINKAYQEGSVSVQSLRRATLEYYRAAIEQGYVLTGQQRKQYEDLLRQVNGVRLLEQSYKRFGRQVSTILTDFGRNVVDILIPKNPTRIVEGLSSAVEGAFRNAFVNLSGMGFSEPEKQLDAVIESIKRAGSVAEANAIAVKNFGELGPEIARGLREGTIGAKDLAASLKRATDVLNDHSKDQEQKLGKIRQLWNELTRSVARAFVEEAGTALAKFVGKHMKDLINSMDSVIQKIPIIGKGLAGIFGNTAGGAGGSIPPIIGSNTGGMPTIPAPTFPGAPPPSTTPTPTGGGGGGGGGSSASGLMGAVNMVAGLGTLASSIVGNFQMMGMNKTLDLIEHEVRYSQIHLMHILEEAVTYWPRLHDIWYNGWQPFFGYFASMMTTVESINDRLGSTGAGAGAGGQVINVYVDGSLLTDAGDARDAFARGISALKLKGVVPGGR